MAFSHGSLIKVRFHVGGPDFHPVAAQAKEIAGWLGANYQCSLHEDKEVFDHLEDTDLLVLMGLFFTQMGGYTPLSAGNEKAFEAYIASGKPLLLHHGAAASYDDSELFKKLIGINWVWGGECPTKHSPIGDYTVNVTNATHPVTAGIKDYTLYDELYYDLKVQPSIKPGVLATAQFDRQTLPMVQVFEGGRVAGAGKAVYLANGHDLKAFECPALKQLWVQGVEWLTGQR